MSSLTFPIVKTLLSYLKKIVKKHEFEVSRFGLVLVEFAKPFRCSEIFSIWQWHFLFHKGLLYVVCQNPITA